MMGRYNDILWARHRLGYNVRLFRLTLAMTQDRLADIAGLGRAYISDVERGEVAASVETIASLATALRIPVNWLLRVNHDVVLPANFRPTPPPVELFLPPGERRDAPAPDIQTGPISTSGDSEDEDGLRGAMG